VAAERKIKVGEFQLPVTGVAEKLEGAAGTPPSDRQPQGFWDVQAKNRAARAQRIATFCE